MRRRMPLAVRALGKQLHSDVGWLGAGPHGPAEGHAPLTIRAGTQEHAPRRPWSADALAKRRRARPGRSVPNARLAWGSSRG